MKRHFKKIAVVLFVIMLFSSMVSYSYAYGIQFENYETYISVGSYSSVDTPQPRVSSSPLVIWIDENPYGDTFYVRAMGGDGTLVNNRNCTLYDGALVDHVVVGENRYYSIKSNSYERGFYYAVISMTTYGGSGTITGEWAPYSAQTFADPTV